MRYLSLTRKELADRTGISEALVKKYIALGLLPPGTGEKRWCRYDDRHVRRITHIRENHNHEAITLSELPDKFAADSRFAFR